MLLSFTKRKSQNGDWTLMNYPNEQQNWKKIKGNKTKGIPNEKKKPNNLIFKK